MKFGKTYKQLNEERKQSMMWKKWFALWPVLLDDGRYVWLETVLKRQRYSNEGIVCFGPEYRVYSKE